MPGVGEAPEDEDLDLAASLAPHAGTMPSQDASPGRATAAKSQSRRKRELENKEDDRQEARSSTQQVIPATDVKEEDRLPQDDVTVEDAAFEKLKLRRNLPGAQTSEYFVLHKLPRFQCYFVDTSETILHKVRLWTEIVSKDLDHNAPDYLKRLAVGVLAFRRCRQADLFLREHALIYWVAEGGKTLRFHAGDCYMKTPSGAFQQHRGVPPDHDRVQTFLLHVEGIFRQLPGDTRRTTEGLLQGVMKMWADAGKDILLFLHQCVDACLRFQGDRTQMRGKRQGQQHQEELQEVDAPENAWNALAAKTILSVKKQLAMELRQDKLLHYMTEWCETPKTLQAAVFMKTAPLPTMKKRCHQLGRCLGGHYRELLPAHTSCYQRLCASRCCGPCTKILQTNILVESSSFQMRSSCASTGQERVERGKIVHRSVKWRRWTIFVLNAPSCHVRPQLCFFDPQIWFQEDEMRKQVEQLNGCIILTGQETPGAKRSLAAGRQSFAQLIIYVICTN